MSPLQKVYFTRKHSTDIFERWYNRKIVLFKVDPL